jgi:hypothetical protein
MLNPPRRHRTCPRALKRQYHNSYRLKNEPNPPAPATTDPPPSESTRPDHEQLDQLKVSGIAPKPPQDATADPASDGATTANLDPGRGQPTSIVDENGRTTAVGYDSLGRTYQSQTEPSTGAEVISGTRCNNQGTTPPVSTTLVAAGPKHHFDDRDLLRRNHNNTAVQHQRLRTEHRAHDRTEDDFGRVVSGAQAGKTRQDPVIHLQPRRKPDQPNHPQRSIG